LSYAFFSYKPSNYCAINIGDTIPAIRKTIVPYMIIGVWLILYIYAKLHGNNEIWDMILYDTGVALIFFTIIKQLVMLYRNRQLLLRLEKLSSTDALTGIYNRHFLDQYIIQFREQPDNSTISMLFIDLVRFKNFNDKYGHLAGDERLKTVVYLIETVISIEHYTIRYGGDEFLILLPDTDEAEAKKINDIINEELDLYNQKNTSIEPLELTIGIFTSDNLDLLKMIDEADKEMYKSKGITQFEYTP
jgi:diguanylate cyclase (GGDEF)-like protein